MAPSSLFEVYADEACSVKPVVGSSYTNLYLKFNTKVGFGQDKNYGEGANQFTQLTIFTPTEGYEEEPYSCNLYVDFFSEETSEPYYKGQVVKCTSSEEITISSPLETKFG